MGREKAPPMLDNDSIGHTIERSRRALLIPTAASTAAILGAAAFGHSARASSAGSVNGLRNVLEFGALGNGVADDAPAFQRAHDAIPATGGELYVPPGVYRFRSPVRLQKRLSLIGAGMGITEILTSNPDLQMITSDLEIHVTDIGFFYDGDRGRLGSANAITCTGGYGPSLFRTSVVGFDTGVRFTAAWAVRIYNSRFWDHKTAALEIANFKEPDKGDHVISGCEFANSAWPSALAAILWKSSGGLKISDCKILNHDHGILATPDDGVNTKILLVTGCSIEAARSSAICVRRAAVNGMLHCINITGNQFAGRGKWGGSPSILHFGPGAADIIISSNFIEGSERPGHKGVYLERGFEGGGLIAANQFFDVHDAIVSLYNGRPVQIFMNDYAGASRGPTS